MKRILWFVLACAVLGGGAYLAHQRGLVTLPYLKKTEQTAQRRPPREERIPVLVLPVKREMIEVSVQSVGTLQGANVVVVKPQVDGRLVEILFKEGQQVKKGAVLARIDATTYQAQYDQAVAKMAQNQALLDNAKRDLERYSSLAKGAYGSQQQADTQKSVVAQLSAQLKLDQATIENAKAILGYTTIVAPIDGRTGLRAVDEGNLVRGSDPAGLVTITQMNPLAVVFNLPQQQLASVKAASLSGDSTVELYEADGKTLLTRGKVEVIDSQIDPTTGTVKVKALLDNDTLALWPGQFVNVRIVTQSLKNVLVVPSHVVQRGPNGPYVYQFKDDKAVLTDISIGYQNGTQAVVEGGLSEGAQIITTGFSRLDDGVKVSLAKGESETPDKGAKPQKPAQ